ncbi:MAG: FkbM family methyltransferase [Planctomycetes bacterium]|nr:FkbM family methyltransferase [Planctomycetota bacterium]
MLAYKTKSLVKKGFRRLGYNLVKMPRITSEKPLPYVRRYCVGGIEFDFWIADQTGRMWYEVEGIEDTGESKALLQLVEAGDKILEIGSHHGFFTTLLAQAVGAEGQITALEAEAKNALIAQAQVTLNQLGGTAGVLHRAGSDISGLLNMSTSDGSNAYATSERDQTTMQVQGVRGDQMHKQYGPYNLLKLDVEGFEGKVLSGCKKLLESKPKLALELHLGLLDRYGVTLEGIFEQIDIDAYAGYMIAAPDFNNIIEFDRRNIPTTSGLHVFLTPR